MIPEIWRELRDLAQFTQEDAEEWYELCRSCKERLESRLRPGVDVNRHRTLLCRAAAGLAFYEAALVVSARGEWGSFAAGDLKLSQDASARLKAAAAVRDARLEEIAPLLRDDRFVFREVKGHG